MRDCVACGTLTLELPVPHPTRSMLSDGRVFTNVLAKSRCPSCGLIQRSDPPDSDTVRTFYGTEYDLGLDVVPSDVARSSAYAKVLIEQLERVPARVLEIGCGSGETLNALAAEWAETSFVGYEAAPQVAASAQLKNPRLEILEGFAEDLKPPQPGAEFDLVFSVNVFEHAVDPVVFLAAKSSQLSKTGKMVIVCPKSHPPNIELVFQDHIYSFTPKAAQALAERVGLVLVHHEDNVSALGDFQLFVFAKSGTKITAAVTGNHEDFVTYLENWGRLDAFIAGALDANVRRKLVFGAGEMAGLLRAYAPTSWSVTEACVVDDSIAGARSLGLPIRRLDELVVGLGDFIIVATHPRAQRAIAQRLVASGATALTFDDLIPR